MALHKRNASIFLLLAFIYVSSSGQEQESMDKTWGGQEAPLKQADPHRGELFRDGNYAMFIHWGLYSHLGARYNGKTYYGISEWIMNPKRADIPVEEYKKLAGDFNPVDFDAGAIAGLAKRAGMKYIIITSKHHDGFAMYDSDVSEFNIVDAGKTDSISVMSAVDLMPTFCELAGKALPEGYEPDGESFASIFENRPFIRSKALFWEWRFPSRRPGKPNSWVYLAVRYGDWKLLADEKRERIELYNIKEDRFEMVNLARSNPAKLNELLAMWDQWKSTLPE